MRKLSSQLTLAVVCTLLGFMLTSQLKLMQDKEKATLDGYDKEDIIQEIDSLKKQKKDLLKENKLLSEELKNIEETAVAEGELEVKIKEDLDKSRMLLGQEDVKGPGIILYINLKSPLVIGQNVNYIREYELTHLVNLLNFSGAEAISINGYRITPQTGIKNASDFIWIGDDARISPSKSIEIRAIGNIENLKKGITFPREMEFGSLINYDYKIEEKQELKIEKSTYTISNKYLEKVNEKVSEK